MFSKFLNSISSVHELSQVTIDVGDGRHAASGACKTWVIGVQTCLSHKIADINEVIAQTAS
jgi:hypothetical protein